MSIATRISRLEHARALKERRPYVFRVSSPPTSHELAEIRAATWPHSILPRKCTTTAEWVMQYEQRGMMQ